mgnify:CR=1 FL=1
MTHNIGPLCQKMDVAKFMVYVCKIVLPLPDFCPIGRLRNSIANFCGDEILSQISRMRSKLVGRISIQLTEKLKLHVLESNTKLTK